MCRKREIVTTLYRSVQRESEHHMVVGTMPAGVCQELCDITLSTGKHHNNYIINKHQGSSTWNNYPRNRIPSSTMIRSSKYRCQTGRCDCLSHRAGQKPILLYQISVSPEDHKERLRRQEVCKEVKCKSPSGQWHGLSTCASRKRDLH